MKSALAILFMIAVMVASLATASQVSLNTKWSSGGITLKQIESIVHDDGTATATKKDDPERDQQWFAHGFIESVTLTDW